MGTVILDPESVVFIPEAPPIRRDPSGAWRVGESQVLVEMVMWAFEKGETAETIVDHYPTADLGDVYGVISYAFRHPEEMAAYLAKRERLGAESRQRFESQQSPQLKALRDRIRSQRVQNP